MERTRWQRLFALYIASFGAMITVGNFSSEELEIRVTDIIFRFVKELSEQRSYKCGAYELSA